MIEAPITYQPISHIAKEGKIISRDFLVPGGELRVGTEEHWKDILSLPEEDRRTASKELVVQGARDLGDVEDLISLLHQLPEEFTKQFIERDDDVEDAELSHIAAA
jgi:hypothetical protein